MAWSKRRMQPQSQFPLLSRPYQRHVVSTMVIIIRPFRCVPRPIAFRIYRRLDYFRPLTALPRLDLKHCHSSKNKPAPPHCLYDLLNLLSIDRNVNFTVYCSLSPSSYEYCETLTMKHPKTKIIYSPNITRQQHIQEVRHPLMSHSIDIPFHQQIPP